MVTSIKNLKNEIDCRLSAGGLEELACCQLQGAQSIINNSIVYSVPDIASLPPASLNEGRFVYVDDINEYRYSDGDFWTDDFSSVAVIFQNQLWAWGLNSTGQLSDGTATNRCSPVREICSAINWRQVSGGQRNTVAIKATGELWAWGCNGSGRLGDGTTATRCSPVREFCSATDWCQVSGGRNAHTAAIKTTGELWTWGLNSCGQLGDGTATNRCSPVRERCSATNWCQVSAGCLHTTAINTLGQLWAWGSNSSAAPQLGDGTTVTRCSPVRERCSATDWCGVSAGSTHTAAIKTSGQIWTWGANACGRLGDGTTVTRCSPVRERCSATDWCGVSAGPTHTAAIKTSGQIWTWGNNNSTSPQLGDGTSVLRCSPVRERCSATDWCGVSAGEQHTAAIKTSGQIWTWGNGGSFQLGDGTQSNRCSPVREISFATDWCQVNAGGFHTIAINAKSKGFLE